LKIGSLPKQYFLADAIEIKELDRDTILTLIDYIEVLEPIKETERKEFRIKIHYKFVGNLDGLKPQHKKEHIA
jgi:hypothetical protein